MPQELRKPVELGHRGSKGCQTHTELPHEEVTDFLTATACSRGNHKMTGETKLLIQDQKKKKSSSK